ncbi:MAG: hypothetical protein AB1925_14065, partial [Actinomycetota bacterium]
IDDLGLACPPDNRSVGPGSWTTGMNAHHDVEWTPPPDLDTGQNRINTHHTPKRLLRPPDDNEEPVAETTNSSEPGGPAPPDNQVA